MGQFLKHHLFDGFHSLYIVLSLLITAGVLFLAHKFLKTDRAKDAFIKFWGLTTFLLHLSPLWLDFLAGRTPIVADNMLFPIFFCNLTMFMLMIAGFASNKKSKGFKHFATVTAYAGSFGALISLFYPEYYLGGTRIDWQIIKSMLSHSTMLVGCLYLITGGYFKVERKNTIVYSVGLLGFGLVGVIVNLIFKIAGLYDPISKYPNAMFLLRAPIDDVKVLNFFVIAILMVLLVYGFGYLGEKYIQNRLQKDETKVSVHAYVKETV